MLLSFLLLHNFPINEGKQRTFDLIKIVLLCRNLLSGIGLKVDLIVFQNLLERLM